MLNKFITRQKPFRSISTYFFACTLVLMLLPVFSFSQDKIYKTDSTIIEVKIQEVGEAEIKYKKFSNPNGPLYKVNIDDVVMIVYENGDKEHFNKYKKTQQIYAPVKTTVSAFDSLGFIAKYLGITLQNSIESDGGIRIIDKEPGHRLKKGISTTEVMVGIFTAYVGFAVMGIAGEFSLKNAVITDVGILYNEELQWKHINKTSDFTKAFLEIARNKEKYNNVATFKIKKGFSSSKGTVNIADINLTSVENSTNEKARGFILAENFNDAIATYAQLLDNDSLNATLLAEDAYALALGGVYDAALMRLDRIWFIGANTPAENFYTAQVFALMGYDDLASEFWKVSDKNIAPAWISSKSAVLLQKYKSKTKISDEPNAEKIKLNFKHANELAAKKSYLQSINLFRKVISICPNEYLPYVGYSISLEKTGAYEKSAQSIEKAISLIGTNPEDKEKLEFLKQRLTSIKGKMALMPYGTLPGFPVINVTNDKQPQMMAYAGGMLGPSIASINGRIGYFISRKSNASLDFGTARNSDYSYTNLGMTIYNRQNNFVSGAGLLLSSGGEKTSEIETESKGTTLFIKLTAGFSKMNEARTSSIDVFFDINKGIGEGALTTWGLSIGKSIYFGKRK